MSSPAGIPENLFHSYAFYSCVVIAKTIFLACLTSLKRLRSKYFVNPEDRAFFGSRAAPNSESVERVRRNHLNDLENVLPFVLIGALYLYTGPNYGTALWHFRLFAGSRMLHTLAYQLPLRQPWRAAAFVAGLAVNLSMLHRCLVTFAGYS